MKAAVFDTYVPKKEGGLMHFDIIVPELTPVTLVHTFGKAYLHEKKQPNQPLTTQECRFCHVEQATGEMLEAFARKGYYILEMQGCN